MLMRVGQPIGRADLGQGSDFIAFPDKPTDLGVTWALAGPMPDDLDHAHLNPATGAQMQLGPAMDFHPPAALIGPLPRGIWFAMTALIAALKTRSVFATATTLTRLARRGGAIKKAIAFYAHKTTCCYPGHRAPKRRPHAPTD